jgi:two-component system phosphate regulon sensor histidine kinase PhoR
MEEDGATVRLRIHHPLFAGFLGVIGLLVLLIVGLVGTGLRHELVSVYQGELARQLSLAEAVLDQTTLQDPDSIAGVLKARAGYRVTLIAPDGLVLGDSDVAKEGLGSLENHGARPEVLGALSGAISFAERRSATVGRRFLYGARPMRFQGTPVVLRIAASLDDIDARVRRGQRAVAGAGLLSILLALVVSYGVSRGLAAPLVALSRRARALAAGDFAQRAPRARVAELDELAVAFNRLTEELQGRLSELARERDEVRVLIDSMAEGVIALTEEARVVRCNRAAIDLLGLPEDPLGAPVDSLVDDPELCRLLAASVRRQVGTHEFTIGGRHLIVSGGPLDQGGAVATLLDVTELRRLEQVRRDFVANASHELKTPLTSLRGWAETLEEDDPPRELRQRFLGSIRKNALRMQRIIDDLLDLSRLESGAWTTQREYLDVPELVKEVWSELADRAEKKGVRFSCEGSGTAMADSHGVALVLRNLFDNALRHVGEGGGIRVDVTSRPADTLVSVSDTGSGIPAAALGRIFERFYRADPARSREEGGTGLGLAIVRHLVSTLGGVVWAESEVGVGTTMHFTLPDSLTSGHRDVEAPSAAEPSPAKPSGGP